MELIIAILCFLGLMGYQEAGVTQEQVEAELRNRKITISTDSQRIKDQMVDRQETR